jgi:hypothetical protein
VIQKINYWGNEEKKNYKVVRNKILGYKEKICVRCVRYYWGVIRLPQETFPGGSDPRFIVV